MAAGWDIHLAAWATGNRPGGGAAVDLSAPPRWVVGQRVEVIEQETATAPMLGLQATVRLVREDQSSQYGLLVEFDEAVAHGTDGGRSASDLIETTGDHRALWYWSATGTKSSKDEPHGSRVAPIQGWQPGAAVELIDDYSTSARQGLLGVLVQAASMGADWEVDFPGWEEGHCGTSNDSGVYSRHYIGQRFLGLLSKNSRDHDDDGDPDWSEEER